MSKTLSIQLSDIQKIIESDWDDSAIKIKIGEFVLQKAIEQNKETRALLDIKFVKEPKGVSDASRSFLARCCRGHM